MNFKKGGSIVGLSSKLRESGFLLFDGAMGTMLQKRKIEPGILPETLNLTHPEWLVEIHGAYIKAGAQVVYTNTFGANRLKLQKTNYTVEQVVCAAVRNARAAATGTECMVALDIGPLGQLLQPAGSLSFDEAYSLFREQVLAGEKAGADLICIETIADLAEARAAVLAAKECSTLPVICTMTFEQGGRTFTGCSVESAAITLEGLGVDMVGINCSLGPDEIYPIVKEMLQWTSLPILVKPNAGLPDPATGAYTITPAAFAESLCRIAALGVKGVGGCCGTDPAFITEVKKRLPFVVPAVPERKFACCAAVCSSTKTVLLDRVRVVGERINPTGKKRFQEAVLRGDMDYILAQALQQTSAGADILDVNVGLPAIDEKELMEQTVLSLQSVVDAPLQFDSTKPEVIERALRLYHGKAIVNSVNGDSETLLQILPIVKKYGAAVIGLTLDQGGIPENAEARFAIAERILKAAQKAGIAKKDVYIDCLTLTASAQQAAAEETLRAVSMVKQRLGLKTLLGVSNISFGLPERGKVNQTFLTMALCAGLDLPILNPNEAAMMDAVRCYHLLNNTDKDAKEYIAFCKNGAPGKQSAPPPLQELRLDYAVENGLKKEAASLTKQLLKTAAPMQIVNEFLIPALDRAGYGFEKGTLFLPQLIQSAGAAQASFEEIRSFLAKTGGGGVLKGHIVIATVKGDIHDIGKNIVKVLLENYGYGVIDLGKDVPPEKVVRAAKEYKAELVGLSALMTTTLPGMEETIRQLHAEKLPCKIMVGGAVLTKDYALQIGADYYAKDAKESVDIAKQVIG